MIYSPLYLNFVYSYFKFYLSLCLFMKNTKNSKPIKSPKSSKNLALRYSIRIQGAVTSISLRKNLVALWLTLNFDDSLKENNLNNFVLDFIYDSISDWKNDNGKGLSDFISDKIIEDILEKRDFEQYQKVFSSL